MWMILQQSPGIGFKTSCNIVQGGSGVGQVYSIPGCAPSNSLQFGVDGSISTSVYRKVTHTDM